MDKLKKLETACYNEADWAKVVGTDVRTLEELLQEIYQCLAPTDQNQLLQFWSLSQLL